jgi:hypothetical protein
MLSNHLVRGILHDNQPLTYWYDVLKLVNNLLSFMLVSDERSSEQDVEDDTELLHGFLPDTLLSTHCTKPGFAVRKCL